MLYYAAPLEGITTYIYRRAHARWYGGIDKYFTPFIAGKKMTTREVRDILPENNEGIALVPQILTNRAGDFLEIAARLAAYGYESVNLNLGCPSGTVTAKKRGAGFLSVPEELDAFLCEIYEKCPLRISIKTRLGTADLREWDRLLDIYAGYPVDELIVHTRLLREFYTGAPHPEAYARAEERLGQAEGCRKIPLCYNGDIVSAESLRHISDAIESCRKPNTAAFSFSGSHVPDRIMIGRGLLYDPALANLLRQTPETAAEGGSALSTLRSFHDEILDGYRQIMSGDLPVLFKMKDLWNYMIRHFTNPAPADSPCSDPGSAAADPDRVPAGLCEDTAMKYLKKIRKADRLTDYRIAVDGLFREYRALCPTSFSPEYNRTRST